MAVAELSDLPGRGVRTRDVRAVEAELRALVGRFDPDDVFSGDATAMWTSFDAIERLAASAKTLLARRVEDTRAWQRKGFRSAAEHLASVSGTSISAAKNVLETSKRVEALPATADALRSGALSQPKAEAIAAAATIAPEAEAQLLDGADRVPLQELRDECLRAKSRADRGETYERIRRERRVREYTDPEGAWNLVARGTPDAGAAFRSVLDPIVDELFKQARAEGRREAREAYAFDALMQLAQRANGTSTGEAKRPVPKYMGLIRVDHEALRRGEVEGEEVCEIAGLGPIPVPVARELLGDAILKLVVTKGIDVANVTHLGRSPTVAQQVALWWQSPMCTDVTCTRSARLENDHRLEWAKTKRTRVDELDRVCDHHHDLHTYFGWAFVAGRGRRPMVPPDDRRHPRNRPPP